MSAALVRQALEFVDPDESSGKGKKRGAARGRLQGAAVQAKKPLKKIFKRKNFNVDNQELHKSNETVKKLLRLSQPTVDAKIAEKIVERAVKGKALADKIEVNNEPEKSILFPDEDEEFDRFEEELFCS